MNKKYLSTKQVCERFGVSHMWIERRIKDSDFPRSIKLGGGRLRYYALEAIEAWEKRQAAKSAAA